MQVSESMEVKQPENGEPKFYDMRSGSNTKTIMDNYYGIASLLSLPTLNEECKQELIACFGPK